MGCPPLATDTTPVPIAKIADSATPDMAIGADLMDIDQPLYRLYVSNHNSDGVDVFDLCGTTTPTYVTTVRGIGGAGGIAAAADINRMFAATPSGALVVIDATPGSDSDNTVIASIDVATSGLDSVEYDPTDHKVYVTVPFDHAIGVWMHSRTR